ncbi:MULTISPECIES: aldose 1-epimerase [unclassified Pseudomonas]|uniref:aldose 1-epimerase n=1 Tax=unclassified Pseudomonas TaxID=196821 RepID=UPI000921372E|nr:MULTISPECIES: aldose 1-epimerase [unclassified Pseudomonas]SFY27916.1 aldose 1-epimerase [Pseudomonas sp. NFACC47-1]SFY42521.1 aldose 1-epimerase [Pseudomonas sp. NFACC43]
MTSPLLHLEDELTRLILAPHLGASLVEWTVRGTGAPLLRPPAPQALENGLPGKLGGFPLIPWSNRIAKGGFDCPGGWLALDANSPNDPFPIHGSAWQQPWQVIEHSAHEALLQLDSRHPFGYRASLRIGLNGGQLQIAMLVTHTAKQPAWHGLGLHPYFPRTAATRLKTRATQAWLCDATKLPTELIDLPAHWDFGEARLLPDTLVDNGFGGWDGHCLIQQPDLGYTLECRASGSDYFLLYCPVGLDFFCFEPVSHPVNAHHLPGRPGLRLLEQGQSMAMQFSMQCRLL